MHIALLGTVPGSGKGVRPELHPALPKGTMLSAWPSRIGVFPATPVERDMQAIGHLEAGLRAAAGGADAVVIDSVGDYGLAALKAGLAVPALGAGEAGIAAASALGLFAIVTVWPKSMNFVPEDLLRAYGLADRCMGIRNVGSEQVIGRIAGPDGYLAGVDRADPAILSKVIESIEAAVKDGAETILLGCTCMSPMAAKIARAAAVPIVNPLAEAVKCAISSAARTPRSSERIISTRASLLTRMIDAIAGEVDEQCPVCVVG
jgi:allantoin racemase